MNTLKWNLSIKKRYIKHTNLTHNNNTIPHDKKKLVQVSFLCEKNDINPIKPKNMDRI